MPNTYTLARQFSWFAAVLFGTDFAMRTLLGSAAWPGIPGYAWIVVGALVLVAGVNLRAVLGFLLARRNRR